MTTSIIAAAGTGERLGRGNKAMLRLCGKPMLLWSLEKFSSSGEVDELIIVAHADEVENVRRLTSEAGGLLPFTVVAGGDTRQHSVSNALAAVKEACDIVLVHDAARPLVEVGTIREVIAEARRSGAAIAAVKAKDTIKEVGAGGVISGTPERSSLWAAQTPQAFRAELLREAYRRAEADDVTATDDAALVERIGVPVRIVTGTYENIKVTTPSDMKIAEALLKDADGIQGKMKDGIREAGVRLDEALGALTGLDAIAKTISDKLNERMGKSVDVK